MKRMIWTRLLLLVLAIVLAGSLLTVGAVAAEPEVTEAESVAENRNPTNEELGGFFSAQRIEWAIKVALQGILMIFAVLALLWGVVAVFKVVLHDIPQKRAAKKSIPPAPVAQPTAPEQPIDAAPAEDEGEIVAAITAAIAAMLESEEYEGQFASGFRVVSFTRKGGAWNKEN